MSIHYCFGHKSGILTAATLERWRKRKKTTRNVTERPWQTECRSIQLQLTGEWRGEAGANSKALTSQKVLQNKNKMSKPKTIMWANTPRICANSRRNGQSERERVSGEEAKWRRERKRRSISPYRLHCSYSCCYVMMAASKCMYGCLCMGVCVSEERALLGCLLGDWDCGLAYLRSNSSVDVGRSIKKERIKASQQANAPPELPLKVFAA